MKKSWPLFALAILALPAGAKAQASSTTPSATSKSPDPAGASISVRRVSVWSSVWASCARGTLRVRRMGMCSLVAASTGVATASD